MSHITDPHNVDLTRPAAAAPPAAKPRGGAGAVLGVVAGVLVAFAAGIVAGGLYMGAFGYRLSPPPEPSGGPAGPPSGSSMGMGAMGGGAPRGGPGGAPGGMGGMGGMRPNPKMQLAGLVSKLDVLTEKPLEVKLTADQRKQVEEQLKGLGDADELADDAAKAKLDKLLDVLKDQKETMEAAGYRWPGGGGGPGGGPGGAGGFGAPPPPNPFKTDANADHLKKLSERMEKGG